MTIESIVEDPVYPRSVSEVDGTSYALIRRAGEKLLVVQGKAAGFQGETQGDLLLCPLTAANAAILRDRLPWLRPQPLGVAKSAGCGDRLGLATPGHIRALRSAGELAPILAQQSMRENARTGRTPQQVLDDAMWGAFQEGWREPWGADADHLKTTADIDLCVAAGYTFYTVDPGDHVDNEAHTAPKNLLDSKVASLPWDRLDDSPERLTARYLSAKYEVEGIVLMFDEVSLARAAAKYGGAIAHTAEMYRHLAAKMVGHVFELEVSVDETETPTSPLEHFFVANELRRLEVQWVSLAPRYIGRFEKGVDYIGDIAEFAAELAKHAAIARSMGPYKLSIHSGSDKFRVYPAFARHAGRLVHLKTAGTSYLEALRAIAEAEPELFRKILAYALDRYEEDSATYHVSADPGKVPLPASLPLEELVGVLDLFDGRQVLHVTFGSVLERFGASLLAALAANEEVYYRALEVHFHRHFEPFVIQRGE
jgi:hypothetical protein